jgi:hypothetical protein
MDRWPQLLTADEGAEYLGMSRRTFLQMRSDRLVRSVLIRGMPRYRRSDLDRLVDELPYGQGNCPANETKGVSNVESD